MVVFKYFLLILIIGFVDSERSNFRIKPRPASYVRTSPRPALVEEEDYEPTKECPEANGFFPDAEQCDKYHVCVDGVSTERLCADGLVFNDFSSTEEKCDLPYNIDCSKRPKLQVPQPTEHCPRKHGYFGHEKTGVCDKFYFCVDGQFNMITCPVGLVFNPKTGICTWPDEVGITGCSSSDVFEFDCPKVNEMEGQTHPRYADPDDCQYFYVCVNGVIPRRNGCKLGQVFDEDKKLCEWARKVPECANWYEGRLTDDELKRLENQSLETKKPEPEPKMKRRRFKGKVAAQQEQNE